MAFIGNQPTAVPLTSSQLADGLITTAKLAADAVTSAKIADSTIVNADIASTTINLTQKVTGTLPYANGGTGLSTLGTANQVLAVNSSATALEYQAVSSDYVLLASTDASNSASVSFDGYFSATYKNYKVIISNALAATDGTTFRVRYRQSNSDKTDANYISIIDSAYTTSTGGATDYDRAWNATSARLNGSGLDNVDDLANLNGEFTIYNPLGTSYKKCFTFLGGNSNSGGNQVFSYNAYGVFTLNTSALSGITFLMDSGNITVGNFKLYGIK